MTNTETGQKDRELWLSIVGHLEPQDHQWPTALHHFTKLSTFREIATTRSILLFNAMTMADRLEADANIRILRQALYQPGQLVERFKQLDTRMSGLGSLLWPYIQQRLGLDEINVHVFCLSGADSAHPDGRLSMWRAFGGDGAGVAIEFRVAPLRANRTKVNLPLLLYRVRYETNTEFLSSVVRIFDNILANADAVNAYRQRDQDKCLWQIYQMLLIASATRKHPGFAEEAEWRLINFFSFADPEGVLQRETIAVGSGIRLGLRFKFDDYLTRIGGNDIGDIINGVVIGPCDPQIPIAQAVMHLLLKLGFQNLNDRWKLCETPYRPNR